MSSNVWVDLAIPNSPANAVPYIDPVDLTPTVDVLNFYYNETYKFMYLAGGLKPDATIAGASGAIAINKPAGVVQFAAAAQSLVLTNSMVKDASSIILCQVLTDDVTAKSAIAVPAAGSATIKLNAAATGVVKVAFFVLRNSEA